MNKEAASLQSGIFEGACKVCPWNNVAESDGKICARSVVNVLITSRDYAGNKYTSYKNINELVSEFDKKAQDCARVLIEAARQSDTDNFKPIDTYGMADVASLLE